MILNHMRASVVIAGGGPAGMMAGFLLARAGLDVIVLEKHEDFLRDFRGDTVHPSTLQVLQELGLLEEFLKRPHQEISRVQGEISGKLFKVADMSYLPTKAKFIALMPQWDFLDFLAEKATAFPSFNLMMRAEAKYLVVDGDGCVTGLQVQTPNGMIEIKSDLVIGADGRNSVLRAMSDLPVKKLGVPIDVLWMRINHRDDDGEAVLGKIEAGAIFVMLYRGDYWQCAFVIAKGGFDAIKEGGLQAFRDHIARLAHHNNANEIASWDDVRLLTVTVDRMEKWWRPGLLFIGDAAHAMSPIGGVGINLAIQDAVAAANILAKPLRKKRVTTKHLEAVQARRLFPTRVTQAIQTAIQNNVMVTVLKTGKPVKAPFILKLAQRWPFLQRLPARFVGLGVRPEHVQTRAVRR